MSSRFGRSEFVFAPQPTELRTLRRNLRKRLKELEVTEAVRDDVLLVVDEIVTNSIEHAVTYRTPSTRLVLRLAARPDGVEIEFEDPDVPEAVVAELASRMQETNGQLPSIHAERGRGLFMVAMRFGQIALAQRVGGGLYLRGMLR